MHTIREGKLWPPRCSGWPNCDACRPFKGYFAWRDEAIKKIEEVFRD